MRLLALRNSVLLVVVSFSWPPPKCQNAVYVAPARPQQATVSILAISTSAHQGFAGNEDVFLAEVSYKGHPGVLAKLMDFYPSEEWPIRHSLLTGRRMFRMELRPDSACDATGDSFFLGSTSELFDQAATERLRNAGKQVLPCFRVDHVATRLR